MRYAIVSDIHSNLQAWNAVLLDLRTLKADKVICLGDVVGYGPNPREVLESAYANINYFVLGNHDAALCGKLDDEFFNDTARTILDWTRTQLGRTAHRFLTRLPLALEGDGFRCAHAEFSHPGYFDYVFDPEDAAPSWAAVSEQLLLVGHTHVPAIFVVGDSGVPHHVEPQDFVLEENKRYLVNVGSVGQPRDGETRASYCVFDSDTGGIFWRRIPFDVDAYRAAAESAEIPILGSHFLELDPRVGVLPVRKMLSFSPPRTAETATHDAVEVRNLAAMRRSARKWKIVAVSVAMAASLALSGGGWAWARHATRASELVHATAVIPISAGDFEVGRNMLPEPDGVVLNGSPLPGWSVALGHKRRQTAEVRVTRDAPPRVVLCSSTAEDTICLSSPPVIVGPDEKLRMAALFRKKPGFKGEIVMIMELTRDTGSGLTVERHIRKAPNEPRKDGWFLARYTPQPGLPAGTKSVRLQIEGLFVGEVAVQNIVLERK